MHVSSCCLELRANMYSYWMYQRRCSAPQPKNARVVFGATHLSDAGAADTALPPAIAQIQQPYAPPQAATSWRHRRTQQLRQAQQQAPPPAHSAAAAAWSLIWQVCHRRT